jgi:hypothetical protein
MEIVRQWPRITAASALTAVLLMAPAADVSAATIHLTSAELATSIAHISFTGDANLGLINGGGGAYYVNWPSTADGPSTETSGITLGAPRGSAGDTFALKIMNGDGNPWDFSVSINNGADSNGPVSIAGDGAFHIFTFTLGAGGLSQVSITVGGDLPVHGFDRGAEYTLSAVAQVPEGGSTPAFLGLGLMILALANRKMLV